MKIDFSKVVFTDESQVTFDGADGWAKGRILSNSDVPVVKKRQQRGGSVMIWDGIVDQTIIGPFKIDEEVKLNSANDHDFIDKAFFTWYKSQSCCFKVKCIFMHDNAPSPVSKFTYKFFEYKRFTGEKVI